MPPLAFQTLDVHESLLSLRTRQKRFEAADGGKYSLWQAKQRHHWLRTGVRQVTRHASQFFGGRGLLVFPTLEDGLERTAMRKNNAVEA
jgi:hypothetical protein